MLHLNTIDESMHRVLLLLFEKEYCNDFYLVGGTSLSLRYGHRKSNDIDLLSPKKFDPANESEQPEILTKGLTWEKVKNIIYTSFISL